MDERGQAVPGKIIQAPCCSYPAPPHSAAWTPFSIRESCLFVPGTLPSILHTSPQFILTETQERSCQQYAILACSFNSTGGLCPLRTLDTKRAPKGAHVAQLRSSPAAEYTLAHAAGGHGQPGHPTFSSSCPPQGVPWAPPHDQSRKGYYQWLLLPAF